MKKSPLKRKTKLRVAGKSTASQLKREIQAVLREAVIRRDAGCVLRSFSEAGNCSGPLQAEHLISRANSATFADFRNIVCLCQRHHIFWKPQHSRLYWELIEEVIGPERWRFIKLAEVDHRPYKTDWKLALLVLQKELASLPVPSPEIRYGDMVESE